MASILKVDQLQLSDGSTPTAGDLGIDTSGSVLQVVSKSLHDPYTLSWQDTTGIGGDIGLNVSIVPKKSNSKFLVTVDIGIGSCSGASWAGILSRNGTRVGNGNVYPDHSGVLFRGVDHAGNNGTDVNHGLGASGSYMDSPSVSAGTTLTYMCGFTGETGTVYINRSESDYATASTNQPANARTTSTITVTEISA